MLEENMIDFGRLDEINQQAIIRSIANSADLQKNIQKACGLQILDEQVIDTNRKAVTEQFSLSSYAKKTFNIYQSILGTEEIPKCGYANGQKLLDQFLSPNRLNLLRTS